MLNKIIEQWGDHPINNETAKILRQIILFYRNSMRWISMVSCYLLHNNEDIG